MQRSATNAPPNLETDQLVDGARAKERSVHKQFLAAVLAEGQKAGWPGALAIVSGIKGQGCNLTGKVLKDVLWALLQAHQADLAEQVLTAALDEGGEVTALGPCVLLMQQLTAQKKLRQTLSVFIKLRSSGALNHPGLVPGDKEPLYVLACRACEGLLAWQELADINEEWESLGAMHLQGSASLPCVAFRTLYRAKKYDMALRYLEPALALDRFRTDQLVNMALNCYSKCGMLEEALELFGRMASQYNMRPDAMSYSIGVSLLAKTDRWREAVGLFWEMMTVVETQDPKLLSRTSALNSALDGCGRADEWEAAVDLLDKAKLAGLSPDTVTYSTMTNLLARLDQCDMAVDMFREMLASGLRSEVRGCNFALTKMGMHGRGAAAVEMMRLMRGARMRCTEVTYTAAIAALYKEGSNAKLLEVYREMQMAGLSPDIQCVMQALKASQTLERWQQCADILATAPELDQGRYEHALVVLARAGQVDILQRVLSQLEARGQVLSEACYTALIMAHHKQGDFRAALDQLRALSHRGRPVGVSAYNCVIATCRDQRNWRAALELFREMQAYPPERRLAPDASTYSMLLRVLRHNGRVESALEVFREMEDVELGSAEAYTEMIMALGSVQRWWEVLETYRGLEDLIERSKPADPTGWAPKLTWQACNEALTACSALGDGEMAAKILGDMRDQGLAPDVVMWGKLIGAWARTGNWKEALTALREMEQQGVPPSMICYSTAISACERGGEWRKALSLLLKSIRAGLDPDNMAYNAAISASAKCGEWQMALKLFDSMSRAGRAPDEVSYGAALLACYKGKLPQKAMELFVAMSRQGVVPSRPTVNILMELLDGEQQFDQAVYVFESMVAAGTMDIQNDPRKGMLMDLHGLGPAVAAAAIRSGLKRLLQAYINSGKDQSVVQDFTFITGLGRHSKTPFEPVLRPTMQDMLIREFDPPLPTEFSKGNEGRLVIGRTDLLLWCVRQTMPKDNLAPAEQIKGVLKLQGPEQLRSAYDQAVQRKFAELVQKAAEGGQPLEGVPPVGEWSVDK